MKSFTILQAIKLIEDLFPFNTEAIRSISYSGNSQNKFKVMFNDNNFYFFDLDEQTYFLIN